MTDGLQKQVEEPAGPDPRVVSLRRNIALLQVLYVLLFGTSLVLIVYNTQARYHDSSTHVWWALALGSAVCVRLIRQSLVRKYNSIISGGRPAPLQ